ncbi:Rna-Binding Motif Protein, X-Linked-Like-3 [Manis pentadactyla]|nr:Rna-Binding Motif Protein, X-Linked-Like-3 [Manis pentadactyla]
MKASPYPETLGDFLLPMIQLVLGARTLHNEDVNSDPQQGPEHTRLPPRAGPEPRHLALPPRAPTVRKSLVLAQERTCFPGAGTKAQEVCVPHMQPEWRLSGPFRRDLL